MVLNKFYKTKSIYLPPNHISPVTKTTVFETPIFNFPSQIDLPFIVFKLWMAETDINNLSYEVIKHCKGGKINAQYV